MVIKFLINIKRRAEFKKKTYNEINILRTSSTFITHLSPHDNYDPMLSKNVFIVLVSNRIVIYNR